MNKTPPTSANISSTPIDIYEWFQQPNRPESPLPVADFSATGLTASDELLSDNDLPNTSTPSPLTLAALELGNQLHPSNTATIQPPLVAEAESFQLSSLSEIFTHLDEVIPTQTETTANLNTPRLEDTDLITPIYPHIISLSSASILQMGCSSTKTTSDAPLDIVSTTPLFDTQSYLDKKIDLAPIYAGVMASTSTVKRNIKENQCDICRKSFANPFTLNNHIFLAHSSQKKPIGYIHRCDVCTRVFLRKEYLKIHKRTHTGEKPFQCTLCNRHFAHQSSLKNHLRIHPNEKPFKCLICGKAFNRKSSLNNHQLIHTGGKQLKCPSCDKTFVRNTDLTRHKKIHLGEKPYQCSQCDTCFGYRAHLKQHQLLHTREKPYQCKTCDMTFANKSNLTRHQGIHTGEKNYQCKICGKLFRTNENLKHHQRTHTGEKPHQCETCDRMFIRKGDLRMHQLTHSNEKPHKCETCDKSYKKNKCLKRHQITHIGKPYQCTTCGKSFSQNCNLKTHQRTHTGEKPYQCTTCGKSFSQKCHLNAHQRRHTAENEKNHINACTV